MQQRHFFNFDLRPVFGLGAAAGAIGGIAVYLGLKYIIDNYKFEITRKNTDKPENEQSNDNRSTIKLGK